MGVLTATNTLDSFTAVISGPLFQGVGTNLLIEETGQLILTSNEGPNVTNNFLEYNRFDEEAETALRAHIAAKEQYSFSFLHEGQDYYGTINYAGYNDWYLIGVVPSASLNEGFQTMVTVFFITVAVLVCLFTFLLLRINHITFKNRESIDRLAYYDELTGCYNVNKFRLEAEPLLAADSDYAFVILDLHDFKFINASFGFETGDRLLCHMKAVLAAHLTEGELYYRRYADQFGFLLHTSDPDEITRRLETIMDAVSAFEIAPGDHYPIYCHCGVKIVRMFSDKLDLDQVQDRASIALKKVKDLHGNLCAFYDEALFTRAQRKSDIEKRMNGALQNRDFIAYIQPKYDLNTGKVCGGEALARWRRDGLLVPPGDFIPVFEENGFVVKLDLYMLETVCRLQESWREQGYPILPLSVNQSRLLFYQESYLDVLRRMVKQYGVTPGSIILEVTESIAVEDIDRIASIIVRLHEIGFSVSMDDFGSGYSSLNMLKELAIDELKLDQGFLARTGYEEKSAVIMRSVIRLAQELHMHTVCEGVETEAQVAMLRSLGCDMAQGFYYAKPMDAGRFARLAYNK